MRNSRNFFLLILLPLMGISCKSTSFTGDKIDKQENAVPGDTTGGQDQVKDIPKGDSEPKPKPEPKINDGEVNIGPIGDKSNEGSKQNSDSMDFCSKNFYDYCTDPSITGKLKQTVDHLTGYADFAKRQFDINETDKCRIIEQTYTPQYTIINFHIDFSIGKIDFRVFAGLAIPDLQLDNKVDENTGSPDWKYLACIDSSRLRELRLSNKTPFNKEMILPIQNIMKKVAMRTNSKEKYFILQASSNVCREITESFGGTLPPNSFCEENIQR